MANTGRIDGSEAMTHCHLSIYPYEINGQFSRHVVIRNGYVVFESSSYSKLRIWMDLNGLKPERPSLLSVKNRKAAEKNYETVNVRLIQ